jgi:TolB-like protein/tRNA A-37 threonylcarbamoyl transferase component Bud32/Tfp pilus assembly protein PilF
LIGRTLGHYRIVERLGAGGMGVVWLAEDTKLKRRVALKMLREDLARSPEKLARFEREAKAVAALNHPNIVTIHSIEEIDGVRFLAMEYVEGRTLDELIPAGGLSLPELLKVAVPVADALAAAHAGGITHRDLKPANVLVGADGRVKVLDFGLAKLQAPESTQVYGREHPPSLTQEGTVVGTLHYMSPEQLQLKHVDHRSDLFALGIVLYEMATGDLPFRGESAAQVISSVLRDEPRRLDDVDARLPAEIGDLVARCLQKDPARRPAAAAEVRDQLTQVARALETGQVHAASARLRRMAARVRRRPPARALAVAAGLAALVLALAWALGGRRGTPAGAAAGGERQPALAVLPLANFSGDPDFFVDGMTDGLIGSLARLGGLRVISRQSAMHYKGSSKLLSEIARELGVDYVVEGSVQRVGDRLLLQAQVVEPDPERHIWTQSYDRPLADALALHNDVAAAVARAVRVRLTPAEEVRMAAARPVDPSVYEAYLQGNYWAGKHGEAEFRRALGYYERAVALDPGFEPAWSGLADLHKRLGFFFSDEREHLGRAEAAVRRALELDPESAEAHAVAGGLRMARWDWPAAEAELARALELGPSVASTHLNHWRLLAQLRRFEEGERAIDRAAELDPLSANILANQGMQRVIDGRVEQALAFFDRAREIESDFRLVDVYAWYAYHALGRSPERERMARAAFAALGLPEVGDELLRLSGELGYERAFARVVGQLDAERLRAGIAGGMLAMAGDGDAAMACLERGYRRGDWDLGWIVATPDYQSLWGRDDFRDLARRMRLPLPPAPG